MRRPSSSDSTCGSVSTLISEQLGLVYTYVRTVGENIDDVILVADNIADINFIAANHASLSVIVDTIQNSEADAAASATAAAASATQAASSATAAAESAADSEASATASATSASQAAASAAEAASYLPPHQELIIDTMGIALVAGTNIQIAVNDGANTITISAMADGDYGDLVVSGTGTIFSVPALADKIDLLEKGTADGVATLNSAGQIPYTQIPVTVIVDVYTRNSEAEQLGLIAQEGDVCIRPDLNHTYIHNGGSAGTMADWSRILTPTAEVTSVDGRVGVVDLSDRYLAKEGSSNQLIVVPAASDNYLGIVENLNGLGNYASANAYVVMGVYGDSKPGYIELNGPGAGQYGWLGWWEKDRFTFGGNWRFRTNIHIDESPVWHSGNFHRSLADPRDFGAIADGITDDSVALQTALNTGQYVALQKGVTYAFGSQLTVPAGGGFIGGGKLIMLTDAGKFDAAAYGVPRAADIAGILLDGADGARVEAEITMQANAGIRVCHPIAVVSSDGVHLDIEAYGFKEMQGGLVSWDSNTGGYVRLNGYDCNPDSTTLGSLQLTGLEVDNNRVASVNSTGLHFDVRVKNIRPGAAARAVYGEQSDGVTIQTQGYSGAVGTVIAEEVGEALDIFGDGCEIRVSAKDCYYFGVKLIHGASGNKISASIDGTGGSAVVISGSDTGLKDTTDNTVEFVATRVGALVAALPPGVAAGILFQGSSLTYKPNRNRVRGVVNGSIASGGSLGMGYAIYHDTDVGTDNISEVESTGHQTGFTNLGRTSTNRAISGKKSCVRAYRSAAASYNDAQTIVYDNQTRDDLGEYDPATGIFTAKMQGRLLVTGQWRCGSVPAGAVIGARIIHNGAAHSRHEAVNTSAGSTEMVARVHGIVEVQPGDTIEIFAITNGTAYAITAIVEYSFLQIDQL